MERGSAADKTRSGGPGISKNVREVTIGNMYATLKESVRHTATGLEANEECLHDV
jgi:hypothetical protein